MRLSSTAFWSGALGFGLGGFFDGVLLHQILQWHHLLSLVPDVTDLRAQVLWDGYFHALMYVIVAIALWRLWRETRVTAKPARLSAVLIGFGLWHIVDAVLSHWILGIHRIKLSPNPLVWDLVWLVAFGMLPFLLGLMAARGESSRAPRHLLPVLAAVAAGTGTWAMMPPTDMPYTTVVFRPGMPPSDVMAAITNVEAGLIWSDASMGVVVADIPQDRQWELYGQGALLVSGGASPAGCFSWSTL